MRITEDFSSESRNNALKRTLDQGVPATKPSLEDTEEAILQKVLEESLTDAYPTQKGPLPPVVFREPDTGKLQPLPEVPGKGKEKVETYSVVKSGSQDKGQAGADPGTLDEGQAGADPGTLDEGQAGSDPGTLDKGQAGSDPGTLYEGQAGSDPGTLDEGQVGSNPDDVTESLPLPTPSVLAGPNLEHSDVVITDPSNQPLSEHMDEGFTATAYPEVQENLKLTVDEQVILEEPVSSTGTLSSLQNLAKDFSFGDQFFNDKPSEADNEKTTADTEAESMVSITIQQDTSITPPMTSPVIDLVSRPVSPNVHWPLPTSTTTTAAPTTTTTTTTLPLPPQLQQGSSESLLIKRMGELEQLMADRVEENQALESRLDKQASRIHKLETMDWSNMIREQTVKFIESYEIDRKIEESVKEVVSSSVKHAMRAPLRARFKDLPTPDMKEILLQRMLEENYDKGHADHRVAYEALRDSIRRDESEDFDVDKAQEETKKKSKQDSPKPPPGSPPSPPPPPPPPSGASGASGTTGASDTAQDPPPPPPVSSTRQEDQSTGTAAPSSSKTAASAEYSAWTTTDSQNKPSITQIPDDLYMDADTTANVQVLSSDDEVGRDHVPTVNLRQSWWKPLTEDRPSTPEPAWTIPSSDLSMPTHNWASALKSTYAQPQENSLLAQTGDMATFMDWFCKQRGISVLTPKDLEGPAFEIIKVEFILERDSSPIPMEESTNLTDQVDDAIIPGGRPALSISKMKAAYYPDVGLEQLVPDQFWIEEECKYDIAAINSSFVELGDLKEYIIAERDFKHMYPSDFEDLYLLNLQGHLNHLSPEDKKILTTAVNLWTRNLVIRHRVEDFQLGIEIIDSPRAVTFRDKYGVQMIMRFNEIHKFSDGTLQQIDEALDYRQGNSDHQTNSRMSLYVLNFFEYRAHIKGGADGVLMAKRTSTKRTDPVFTYRSFKDVWLENRQVWRFCWLHIRRSDTYTGNPVKEILLKMNLPDHRIKQKWRWSRLVPVESIHHPMLTLNASK
ncbi:hypothetical protein Tco_1194079 [Tanacetum coccineum]